MPNWITNIFEATGSPGDIKRLMAKVKTKKGKRDERLPFDFNEVVRMPRELSNIRDGACTINGVRCEQWYEMGPSGAPEPIVGAELERLMKKTGGFKSWYDWSCRNWGTKWNACHPDDAELQKNGKHHTVVYRFDSAWSPPEPVYRELSKMFPKVDFSLYWQDEGDNEDHNETFKNGKRT